ncbi:MAG: radical SAM protein [Promethearchaeota archaeon]
MLQNSNNNNNNNNNYRFVFGVVPSRRLGKSLGISPIPRKSCNYSCIYCQLGRTLKYTKKRSMFFEVEEILAEIKDYIEKLQYINSLNNNQTIYNADFYDYITIVGDGEPTLYLGLDKLIDEIKKIQNKPLCIISNGSLLTDDDVFNAMTKVDMVMLNFDAWDEKSHIKINRPLRTIKFDEKIKSYQRFRKKFKGILSLEVMLIKGINDKKIPLLKLKELAKSINPDEIFLNAPVRPPAEPWVEMPTEKSMKLAHKIIPSKRIDYLPKSIFKTIKQDPYTTILEIIGRHPMRIEDIQSLIKQMFKMKSKKNIEKIISDIIEKLENTKDVKKISYKNSIFFRIDNSN